MKSFFRSLRYLWPYRGRLAISITCVLLIAVLWGGSLGMILPGAKILISQEGLHGWAWNSVVEDKLGARVVQRMVPAQIRVEGQAVSLVIDIVSVDKGSPADKAGIQPNSWIVGLGGDDVSADDRILRADVLARRIAHAEGGTLELRIHDPHGTDTSARSVRVTPGDVRFSSDLLRQVAVQIPEPADYSGRYEMLAWLLVIGLSMTLLRDVLRFTQEYLVQTAVLHGVMDLRCENYGVVLRLPTTFFSEKGVSDTMSRFIADTGELSRGQVTLFGKTLVEPAKAVASICVALLVSWKLTLVAMVAGPPAYLLIRKFGKRMRRASTKALENRSLLLGVLEETLNGIRVVKAYTMEGTERRRFFRTNRALLKQQRRMARIDSATSPTVEALGIAAAMGAAAVAGYWVFNYQMRADDFLALMACLGAMFDPLRKLAKVVTRFQRADAAAARVFELQDEPQEKRVPNAPMLPRHHESIEFDNVQFRYPSSTEDVLKDIDLRIEAGQTVAIVGPNGSGKTTLLSLVPRLIDPTGGVLRIDGLDASQISLRSLRRQIGLVTQDTVLFHATIAENISYGLRRPKREAVLEAAKKAFVDEFVRDLPDGYDTMVGEHGATLSGGQRQRITIARAILRDPAILIFDEAMSQIDSDSERRIHQAMEEFVEGRTTLLIAHRFATVLSADRIVVMDRGRIVDVGPHEELLERCELYSHLYRTQFIDSGG
jgi:ATP-binding cassette, subfamily B, bacterial MsbA